MTLLFYVIIMFYENCSMLFVLFKGIKTGFLKLFAGSVVFCVTCLEMRIDNNFQ